MRTIQIKRILIHLVTVVLVQNPEKKLIGKNMRVAIARKRKANESCNTGKMHSVETVTKLNAVWKTCWNQRTRQITKMKRQLTVFFVQANGRNQATQPICSLASGTNFTPEHCLVNSCKMRENLFSTN